MIAIPTGKSAAKNRAKELPYTSYMALSLRRAIFLSRERTASGGGTLIAPMIVSCLRH
jgi:hypothetical protein